MQELWWVTVLVNSFHLRKLHTRRFILVFLLEFNTLVGTSTNNLKIFKQFLVFIRLFFLFFNFRRVSSTSTIAIMSDGNHSFRVVCCALKIKYIFLLGGFTFNVTLLCPWKFKYKGSCVRCFPNLNYYEIFVLLLLMLGKMYSSTFHQV